ncbi:unnamed protein product, partial [Chrysoparadoxa australica]
VDPKQNDRATEIKLFNFSRPHMRGFHLAWMSFFMAFVAWFSFAPLMPEVRKDLGLTKEEVYTANITSVLSTVFSRFLVGPLCDTFGARLMASILMFAGAVPTALSGLVSNGATLAVVRFFIGFMGAVFVCTQTWSAALFAKEIVGTANAITAGWGNLGGGVAQLFMIAVWNLFKTGMDSERAWRLSFLVPAGIVVIIGFLIQFLGDDCPKGNFKDLIAEGSMQRKSSSQSFKQGYTNVNSWLMFIQYATCFGIELTINNVAATYFHDKFGLSTSLSGTIASLFGLMNLFARPCGGMYSDFLHKKFGAGTSGMRGRLYAQGSSLLVEGLFLILFSRMNNLGAAIACLILFSLGVQSTEGTSYGIVPYICPDATGAVSGIVGAGGNFGAVCWGLIFRFGPSAAEEVLMILGIIVCASVAVTPLIKIKGHASIFSAAEGEPDAIDTI